MLVVITYDVNTETPAGRKRLRNIAKICVNRGQRVQSSVFECKLDQAQFIEMKNRLSNMIDPKTDSLRFYLLGNNYQERIEHVGARPSYDPEQTMII